MRVAILGKAVKRIRHRGDPRRGQLCRLAENLSPPVTKPDETAPGSEKGESYTLVWLKAAAAGVGGQQGHICTRPAKS